MDKILVPNICRLLMITLYTIIENIRLLKIDDKFPWLPQLLTP